MVNHYQATFLPCILQFSNHQSPKYWLIKMTLSILIPLHSSLFLFRFSYFFPFPFISSFLFYHHSMLDNSTHREGEILDSLRLKATLERSEFARSRSNSKRHSSSNSHRCRKGTNTRKKLYPLTNTKHFYY